MRTRFITSAPHSQAFPDSDLPEVAFVGRSNVGKSSLLNKVAGAKIARTSKTPGRTQAVNFFEVSGKGFSFVLADLPGYGYAKAGRAARRAWYEVIEAYLESRTQLKAVLLLIDIRRGVQPDDEEVYGWLGGEVGQNRDLLILGTKADKLSKAKRKPVLHGIAADLGADRSSTMLCSSLLGIGVEELRERLIELGGHQG